MSDPTVIVAMDFDDQDPVLNLLPQLDPNACAIKIGITLFTRYGPALVEHVQSQGFKVFLDLKFHDIPMQVAGAVKSAADLGVWMLSLHASGGPAMLREAKAVLAPYGDKAPLLMAITLLTSLDADAVKAIGYAQALETSVLQLARLAEEASVDGVVSSAHELAALRNTCGPNFKYLTPGIRLESVRGEDQVRVMTPRQALAHGSNYLVIGRPITQAANPAEALNKILLDIK